MQSRLKSTSPFIRLPAAGEGKHIELETPLFQSMFRRGRSGTWAKLLVQALGRFRTKKSLHIPHWNCCWVAASGYTQPPSKACNAPGD